MKKFIVSLILTLVLLMGVSYATGNVVKITSQYNNVNVHCEDGVNRISSYRSIDFPEASKQFKVVRNSGGNYFNCESGRCSYRTVSQGSYSDSNDFSVKKQSINAKFGKGSCLNKASHGTQHSVC